MSKTEDNFKKYQASLLAREKANLRPLKNPPTDLNLLMLQLAKEGHEILNKEELQKCNNSLPITTAPSQALESALASIDKNPYVRARNKILSEMPIGRRTRILEMETTGKIENNEYQEFTRMIQKLGDSFSK